MNDSRRNANLNHNPDALQELWALMCSQLNKVLDLSYRDSAFPTEAA